MSDRKSLLNKTFLAISVLGTLFVLTEAFFQSLGSSICATEGCRVVTQASRFGDIPILMSGLAAFSSLAVLSAINLSGKRPVSEKLIDLILVVSLAAEGFFTGYQAFRLFTPCLFCLSVFGFLVVLALLRLAAGRKELTAGFASLFAVFSLFYLVLPSQSVAPLPDDRKPVLFYSSDCKYCSEVIEKFREFNFEALHVPAGPHSGALKSIGIVQVPTLLVNRGDEKIFLTGRDAILRYLSSADAARNSPRNSAGSINELFAIPEPVSGPPPTSPGNGACMETAPCD